MDAVAEEYAFCINYKVLILSAFLIAIVRIQNSLEGLADCEVVLEILVGEDVAAAFGSFAKIIDVFFLLQRQIFPIRDLITHHFQVGELVDEILELFILSFLFAWCTSS